MWPARDAAGSARVYSREILSTVGAAAAYAPGAPAGATYVVFCRSRESRRAFVRLCLTAFESLTKIKSGCVQQAGPPHGQGPHRVAYLKYSSCVQHGLQHGPIGLTSMTEPPARPHGKGT